MVLTTDSGFSPLKAAAMEAVWGQGASMGLTTVKDSGSSDLKARVTCSFNSVRVTRFFNPFDGFFN